MFYCIKIEEVSQGEKKEKEKKIMKIHGMHARFIYNTMRPHSLSFGENVVYLHFLFNIWEPYEHIGGTEVGLPPNFIFKV